VIQRDYIERLIEQCTEFLRRALQLRKAGELEPSLQVLREAHDDIGGSLRPLLERLEATSAVEIAGLGERERVRLFAGLVAEESLAYRALGNRSSAQLCGRRALELYAALAQAGTPLDASDRTRIAMVMLQVKLRELDSRYREELRRLTAVKPG
jgi:hypothetical protein